MREIEDQAQQTRVDAAQLVDCVLDLPAGSACADHQQHAVGLRTHQMRFDRAQHRARIDQHDVVLIAHRVDQSRDLGLGEAVGGAMIVLDACGQDPQVVHVGLADAGVHVAIDEHVEEAALLAGA